MFKIKILDKYILQKFMTTFVFVLFVLAIISIVIDFTEKVDAFVNKQVPTKEILSYYIAFVPYISALLFPLFVFISVIFFTTRLAYKTEVIAMLNSGMSFNRFLAPYLVGGVILSGVILYSNHILIPKANKQRLKFENKYINFNSVKTGTDMHFRISGNEFIYLKSYNIIGKNGYNFCYEKIEGQTILEKLWAENIAYDTVKKIWNLSQVTKRTLYNNKETFNKLDKLSQKFNFAPSDLVEEFEMKQAMTTSELTSFIIREKRKGNPSLNVFDVERYRRSAAPYSVLILTLIGACMASQKVRGGSGLHLALGLLISASYIIFMQFSTTFSIKGTLHPALAVWIPNIIFTVLAYYIYKKYNK
jgi:lipopolysaccharide export system permease protein